MKTHERDGARSHENLNDLPDDVWKRMQADRDEAQREADQRKASGAAGCYEYFLVRGNSERGTFYIVGVEGQDDLCWHGFIVHATDDFDRVGRGAIEWKEDIEDGWEGRYFISKKPLPAVIAEAERKYS